jgi:hypothetical protein
MDARPQFFEGQYIGADDLQTIVAYARERHAQHLLAGHGWGIAAGLELIEQSNPDGSVSVWLQPGYAWDGYGRSVLVDTPTPLDATQLQGNPTGAWFVWLSYTETPQDAARASYGVCEGTDAFLRVAEGFQIVISGQLRLDQQQSGVLESGTVRPDARLVRRISDPTGPFLCDANIPEQGDNPLGGKAIWLVPVGLVGWNSGTQQVVGLSDLQKQGARLFRRNVASVAEEILAPGGLVRLRPHGILDPTKTDADVNTVCTASQPLTSDLVTVGGKVTFDDLVWVEGNLRVLGNARIYGGELDLRMSDGSEPAGSLFLRRSTASAATTDLEISIGNPPAGPGPVNRLVVAPSQNGTLNTPPALSVLADGRVGIGVAVPGTGLALDVNGNFGHDAGPTTLHLMGSRITDAGDGTLLLTAGGNIVELGADGGNGQVGINTKSPQPGAALDIHGGGIAVNNNPAFVKLLGSDLRDQGDGILHIRSGGSTVAFDGGDQVGINTTTPGAGLMLDVNGQVGISSNPAVLSLIGSQLRDQGDGILRIRSGGNIVTFDGANQQVGIGTAAPGGGLLLDVNGQVGISSNPAVLSLLGSQLRDQGDGILRIRSGGNTVTFDGNDNVGIGTTAPSVLLDVAGNALIEGSLTVNGFFNNPSDMRLKQDIKPLAGALGRLLALRGVEFEWSREDLARLRPGRQVGLIADEVERVFPAWVNTDPKTGMKMLSPQGFEGVVVEAMRELSQRVDALAAESQTLHQLKQRVDTLEEASGKLEQLDERIDALVTENRALIQINERMDALEKENRALRDQLAGGGAGPPQGRGPVGRRHKTGTPQ